MSTRMVPVPYRITDVVPEITATVTFVLDPVDQPIPAPVPGQFTMLSLFALGEAPISVSALPRSDGSGLHHTVRAAGAFTTALTGSAIGTTVGVRGPFGHGWPLPAGDVVVAAGGIGLAPLLPALRALATRPTGRLAVLVGARRPGDVLAAAELAEIGRRHSVHVTVDAADRGWDGHVGVVSDLVRRVPFALDGASALVCGPEVMIRFTARELAGRGLRPADLHVSLERNMQCGFGACGHCQLGPVFCCTDGPVVAWSDIEPILAVRSR